MQGLLELDQAAIPYTDLNDAGQLISHCLGTICTSALVNQVCGILPVVAPSPMHVGPVHWRELCTEVVECWDAQIVDTCVSMHCQPQIRGEIVSWSHWWNRHAVTEAALRVYHWNGLQWPIIKACLGYVASQDHTQQKKDTLHIENIDT